MTPTALFPMITSPMVIRELTTARATPNKVRAQIQKIIMNSPANQSLAGSSPIPFRVDAFVKTQLVDANGKTVADFHPPGMRTEPQLAESIANCALVARLFDSLMSQPDVP